MRLALQKMKKICIENNITKIAMPTIGAGLDRLVWSAVSDQMYICLDNLDTYSVTYSSCQIFY